MFAPANKATLPLHPPPGTHQRGLVQGRGADRGVLKGGDGRFEDVVATQAKVFAQSQKPWMKKNKPPYGGCP